jgi:hypothetical protein
MKIIIVLLTIMIQLTSLMGQTKTNERELKNQFRFSLGLGYEDGLIFLNRNAIPTLGMAYERRLSRYFALSAYLLLYYRAFSNNYVESPNFPLFTKYRGSLSPLMTQTDRDKLASSGIIQIRSEESIMQLSVPIDAGFTFYPINKQRHRLGIYFGFGFTYESHNWYQDYLPGVLTLADGSKVDMTLSVPTEFRNFSPGFSTKLMYDYQFKNYAVGARLGNNNYIFDALFDANQPVWETSIYWSFKF